MWFSKKNIWIILSPEKKLSKIWVKINTFKCAHFENLLSCTRFSNYWINSFLLIIFFIIFSSFSFSSIIIANIMLDYFTERVGTKQILNGICFFCLVKQNCIEWKKKLTKYIAFENLNLMKIGFLKSKPGTLRNNFPKLFTDDFIEQFNWDGIGKNKFSIKSRVFISHILYGLCFYNYYHYVSRRFSAGGWV